MTRGKQKPNHAGNEERRSFLKGAAALGGGAAASLILPSVAQAAEAAPASEREPGKSAGYRVTDHVVRYYETLKS